MRVRPLPVLAFTAAVLVGGSVPAPAQQRQDVDHAEAKTVFVRILQSRLRPEVQRVPAGDSFGWLNYSDDIARISFDADVAKHLTCRSPGSFRRTGDRLESGDIQSQQFATLCNLAPGEYRYRVDLRGGIGGAGGSPGASRTGTLVIE